MKFHNFDRFLRLLTITILAFSLVIPVGIGMAENKLVHPAPASPELNLDPGVEQGGLAEAGLPELPILAGNVNAALTAGAARLAALQNLDGGWDWPLDDGNPSNASPLNTIGPIGMGLAKGYWHSGDAAHSFALEYVGAFLLTKTNNFSPSDGYLAAELDRVFGGTTYVDFVTANFYGPLAAGTYNRNGAGTLYDTAAYVNLIRANRSGLYANLAAWDIGMGLVGASAAGADTTAWVAGVKAEIDELDGDVTVSYYDVIGLAGAVYGLAYAGEDYDPIAGEHEAAGSLADLAAILASYQIAGGGFAWSSAYVIPNDSNETIQETAYAVLALSRVNRNLYLGAIQGAAEYMLGVQLATGGWENYPGSGENNEITAEALWGIHVAAPEVWVAAGIGGDLNSGERAAPKASIQAGIDAVASGGTVNVLPGLYVEQLEITKQLTLLGSGPTTVVQSPDDLAKFYTTSVTNYPVVYVHDANSVTIRNLVVDGAGKGNANYRFQGIGYHNAGGTIDTVTVQGVRDTPFSGAQHGVALYVYNHDGITRSINVWGSTFIDFQKTAMALNTDAVTPLVVDVRRNVVTGAGPTTVTAQNGIQVWADLGRGTVADNTVSGIAYAGTGWVATSILNFYTNLDITGNTVSDGHTGIYNIDGSGSLTGNTLNIIKAGGYGYGIIATDPPLAVPSPFGEAEAGESAPSLEAVEAAQAVLNIDVSGNTLTFSGADNTATYGIEADAGYGVDDIAFAANNNTVTGFEVAIGLYQCESGCSTGVFTAATATQNCLAGNTTGMETNVSYLTVNGESNWWGAATGPAHASNPTGTGAAVSDNVDFTPWLDACGGNPTGNWQNVDTGELFATLQAAIDASAPGDEIKAIGSVALSGGAIASQNGLTINLNGGTFGPGSPFMTVTADNVSVLGPGTLDGNGSTDPAILVQAGADNFTMQDIEVREWANGVQIAGPVTSFKLVNNFIHNNTAAGLQVDAVATLGGVVTIEGNLFKDNGGNGVQNDNGAALDATYNSWGSDAGPASPMGDGASANVTFDPWTFAELYLDMVPPNEAEVRSVLENDSFDVAIKGDAENLYGLSFKFSYNPSLLQFNSTTFSAPWIDRCFPVGTPPAGTVSYRCALISGEAWDGGTIATFNFTATGSGLTGNGPWTDVFDISHLVADTSAGAVGGVKVFVNNTGFNAASVVPDRDITDLNDGQVTITGLANFTGFIDLQGRANDSSATLTVYDQLLKAGSTALASASSAASGAYTTAYLGSYQLAVGSAYYFQVDAPLYLPTTQIFVGTAETDWANGGTLTVRPLTPLAGVVLLGGDATNDDVIGIDDATCIGADYGTASSTCLGTSTSSDVNGDGRIDILDLVLMGGNFDLESSPWTQTP